jgi:hypothetical protein
MCARSVPHLYVPLQLACCLLQVFVAESLEAAQAYAGGLVGVCSSVGPHQLHLQLWLLVWIHLVICVDWGVCMDKGRVAVGVHRGRLKTRVAGIDCI